MKNKSESSVNALVGPSKKQRYGSAPPIRGTMQRRRWSLLILLWAGISQAQENWPYLTYIAVRRRRRPFGDERSSGIPSSLEVPSVTELPFPRSLPVSGLVPRSTL